MTYHGPQQSHQPQHEKGCVDGALARNIVLKPDLRGNPIRRVRLNAKQQGFTLIELVVVIIIVMVMMAIFLNRVRYYQEQAEKTAMEEVAGALQSALILQYGQLLARGKAADVPALMSDNPMNWLQKKPRTYAGEFFDPSPNSIMAGNWMFDLKSRDLIYVPRNHDNLRPAKDGKVWIRFHVTSHYETSRLPSLQNDPPSLTGVLFEPVEPYVWF